MQRMKVFKSCYILWFAWVLVTRASLSAAISRELTETLQKILLDFNICYRVTLSQIWGKIDDTDVSHLSEPYKNDSYVEFNLQLGPHIMVTAS